MLRKVLFQPNSSRQSARARKVCCEIALLGKTLCGMKQFIFQGLFGVHSSFQTVPNHSVGISCRSHPAPSQRSLLAQAVIRSLTSHPCRTPHSGGAPRLPSPFTPQTATLPCTEILEHVITHSMQSLPYLKLDNQKADLTITSLALPVPTFPLAPGL